ncbi:hypothetical protein Aab01nite_72800 [Paractinoplanes abujensis]|uniref:Uncharacterized protein n=1 Tax=Paractinoplanes abujensis TaxID=882441 RepID=A0A7W7G279_9ACTN|nr:hypothetical protein [Actinoplanes abujensis]MBB4694958.1 hypothetical protein [Actinoplanes abujensis]GID23690.1 hypothetical protein Aab01nite_72800 [Actinoplanes abujensis]
MSRVMRLLTVAALAVAVLLPPGPAQAATRSYPASSEVFANPGRGFFTYSETRLGAAYEPLIAADLTRAPSLRPAAWSTGITTSPATPRCPPPT